MITIPTLSELNAAISADFKERFSISSENDLKRVLTALSASNAAMLKLFYLALADVQNNLWPDKAYSENNGGTLERFGRLKLNRNPYPAIQGVYILEISGSIGATLQSGTQFKSSADSTCPNKLFTTTETVVLTATVGTVQILADQSGTESQLAPGDVLFTVNPITNISSIATVTEVETIATDAEDIEAYRELVLQAFRLEPNGGSASDYVSWAMDVDGIRTVYPYTTPGVSGVVSIYVEATEESSLDEHGTPSQALMDALWKPDKTGVFEIDPDITQPLTSRGRRQLGLSDITIAPVTPLPVTITIVNLKLQTAAVQTSIQNEIEKVLYYKRPFVAGVGNINDKNDTLYLSDVIAAIQNAIEVGNTFDDVAVNVNGLGIPFQFINGNIPYLSEVIYD